MARIFIDGFESGGLDLWDTIVATASVASSVGKDMNGDYCAYLTTGRIDKNLVADDEMYFAFLYRPTVNDSRGVLCLYKDSTLLIDIRRDNGINDPFKVYRDSTLIATGSATIAVNTTYLIEIRIKIADAGGRAVLKVDGVTDIDFTGDTKPGADTQFNKAKLGYGSVAYAYAYYDNFIMDDANWIGNTKIQAIKPSGAGNSTGWTPSAGANWDCVEEIPKNDADYVHINSNDVTDTYAAANMAGSIGTVKCVQVQSRAKYDGSPVPTNLKLVVRSGGADYLSGDKAVPASEKSLWHLWETNPADSLAWEEADVNAMEIGVKSAA